MMQTKIKNLNLLLKACFLLSFTVLFSCSDVGSLKSQKNNINDNEFEIKNPEELGAIAIDLISKNDLENASKKLNQALKLSPSNSGLHYLNALTYHLQSSQGDQSKLPLAAEGYKLALKFDNSNWLARYNMGLLYLDQRKFEEAKEEFGEALLFVGKNPDVLYHMGFASYYSQDVSTAAAIFDQLQKIEPTSDRSLQASAMISAAINQPEQAHTYVSQIIESETSNQSRIEVLQKRLKDWEQVHSKRSLDNTSSVDQPEILETDTTPAYELETDILSDEDEESEKSLDMIVLDVVIISTEETVNTSRGVNLLQGLNIQFGDRANDENGASFATEISRSDGDRSEEKLFSSLITIPGINYSLNIANSLGNRNEILARPSLVASNGQESHFFAGIELDAGATSAAGEAYSVSKEIGVTLDITPEIEDDGKIGLEITARRTFLKAPSSAIRFDYAVEVSKTEVTANVIMREGETIILSGLSEKETAKVRNGTPLLQDLPIIQYAFSNKTEFDLQKSVLILVTPRKPDYVYKANQEDGLKVFGSGSDSVKSSTMKELRAKYLDWFKPYPNTASVFKWMQGNSLYREFRTGDVSMEKWAGRQTLRERLKEAATFLYY